MGEDGTLNYHLIADAENQQGFQHSHSCYHVAHDSLHISVVASFSTEVSHDNGHISYVCLVFCQIAVGHNKK